MGPDVDVAPVMLIYVAIGFRLISQLEGKTTGAVGSGKRLPPSLLPPRILLGRKHSLLLDVSKGNPSLPE